MAEDFDITTVLIVGGVAFLAYKFLSGQGVTQQPVQTLNPDGSGYVAVTAVAAGQTVSTQAQPVPVAPILPGVDIASPGSAQVTPAALAMIAANAGYPAPQMFTVWQWNYFYTKMTGIQITADPSLFGVNAGTAVDASYYAQALQSMGLIDSNYVPVTSGLSGVGRQTRKHRGVNGVSLPNASYVKGAVQLKGLAPIHGWD